MFSPSANVSLLNLNFGFFSSIVPAEAAEAPFFLNSAAISVNSNRSTATDYYLIQNEEHKMPHKSVSVSVSNAFFGGQWAVAERS